MTTLPVATHHLPGTGICHAHVAKVDYIPRPIKEGRTKGASVRPNCLTYGPSQPNIPTRKMLLLAPKNYLKLKGIFRCGPFTSVHCTCNCVWCFLSFKATFVRAGPRCYWLLPWYSPFFSLNDDPVASFSNHGVANLRQFNLDVK